MRTCENDRNANLAGGQRGAAVVFALFAMVLIAVLAAAFISTGMISGNVSLSSRQQTEAYYISEAGLNHAIQMVSAVPASTPTYTNFIRDYGDTDASWTTGYDFPDSSRRYYFKIEDDIHATETDGDEDVDTNKRLLITSVGRGRDWATATTEAIVTSTTTPALLINGPLLISGNPRLSGSNGIIHANGPVTVSGNPCVSGAINSTTTVSVSGSVRGADCTGTGVTQVNQLLTIVPTYNIQADFKHRADYILGSDGKVTLQNGTVIHNSATQGSDWYPPGSGGKWTWESGNQKWKHGNSAMLPNTTFYAVGNMELGADFGSAASPVAATFIAEGSITVSANPYVRRHLDDKFAFMAGKDLTISGNPTSGFNSSTGIHYGGDQIKISGTASISGLLIAGNKTDTPSPGGIGNPVPLASGNIEISGDARIHYDDDDLLIDVKPILVSWREVRN